MCLSYVYIPETSDCYCELEKFFNIPPTKGDYCHRANSRWNWLALKMFNIYVGMIVSFKLPSFTGNPVSAIASYKTKNSNCTYHSFTFAGHWFWCATKSSSELGSDWGVNILSEFVLWFLYHQPPWGRLNFHQPTEVVGGAQIHYFSMREKD